MASHDVPRGLAIQRTPGSPRTVAAGPSSMGRRHLKRLSLASSPALGSPSGLQYVPREAELSDMAARHSTPLMQRTRSAPQTAEPAESPRLPPPSSSANRPRTTGHGRRQSSISYRSSPSLAASPALSTNHFSPAASPLAGRSRSQDTMESLGTPTIEEEPSSSGQSSPKPGDVMHSGATLVQQHGELLSFIAQKERKCLDLREELKKEEAELKRLKAKWESVVAREVASSRAQPLKPQRLMPRKGTAPTAEAPLSPGGSSREITPTASPDPMSPHLSPRPSGPATDISSSAKRWMGGLVKSANAMLENLAAPIENLPNLPPTPLQTLAEEEEEERSRELEAAPGSPSTSSVASQRRMSASSLTTDESSAFFDKTSTTRSSSMSSMNDLDGSSSCETLKYDPPVAMDSGEKTPTPLEEKGGWLEQADAAEQKARDELLEKKHARRRSTFEALGQAATSFGTGMSQRWGAVTGSETFRNSKKATLSFVDAFERTLADAVYLEESSRSTDAPSSPRKQQAPSLLDSLVEEDENGELPTAATAVPSSPQVRSRSASPKKQQHSRMQSSEKHQWQLMSM